MRHDLFRFSGEHIPHAAVLIQRTEGGGTHTGLIFRGERGELRLLHFFLDGSVRDWTWDGTHPHVIPNADDDALANLASLCRVVAKRYERRGTDPSRPRHLYGFRRSPHAFVHPTTGELDLGASNEATCASFVLIVLSSARLDFVVPSDDWPYRPAADDAAHARILGVVESDPRLGDPRNIVRMRAGLPTARVAPEEVAAAGMCPEPPADQPFAEKAGQWILELISITERYGYAFPE